MKCLTIVLILSTTAALAADPYAESDAMKAKAPADVTAYMGRVFLCKHFGGEPAYSGERQAELEAQIADLGCNTTVSADGEALRAKYANSPEALKAMAVADGF